MRLYDDWKSYIHTLTATASVLLGIEVPVTLCFLVYELKEGNDGFLGDVIEYMVGLFIGGILNLLVRILNINW